MKKTVSELWSQIFSDYNILDEINTKGFYYISADIIREYKEPRLMTKFDFSKQLPEIFKNNDLGILPTNNGKYIIGKFDLFKNISTTNYESIEPIAVQLPEFIETIDPDDIYSESNALNVALLSGMIKDAVGEDVVETIQGKMRATGFTFTINGKNGSSNITINRPAMEIDGGYEGEKKVALIEAKNYLPKDFILRQLYFPYRHWFDKLTKPIVPIFFAYDNGVYTFFIYKITDLYNYNSFELESIKRYIISNNSILNIKKNIFDSILLVDEPLQEIVPFPQADTFNRVIAIVDMINSDINNVNDIADEFEFDVRQGSYYLAAARYLNLINKENNSYKLSVLGYSVANVDMKKRNRLLIEEILKHKVFYYSYKFLLENDSIPTKEFIIDLMKKYTDIISEETLNRRASTVRGWISWINGAQV